MIDIKELKTSDIGRWVTYTDGVGETQIGRIKSWNDKVISVVYQCDHNWHRFEEYTGEATEPIDLIFGKEYKMTKESKKSKTQYPYVSYLSDKQANQVFDLLVRDAGAPEQGRSQFLQYTTDINHKGMREFRFCGWLGFGGKLYLIAPHAPHISCYPEDETDRRRKIIYETNLKLIELHHSWIT